MTPAALVTALAARGVRLTVVGDRLHVDAPRGELTAADRTLLEASKPSLLALLSADEETGKNSEITTAVPDGPCGLCRSPLTWVDDWPTAGAHRWLCLTCAARPIPTLADVYASLSDEERARLEEEAAHGDDLSRDILNELELAAPAATTKARR